MMIMEAEAVSATENQRKRDDENPHFATEDELHEANDHEVLGGATLEGTERARG
jgi:hypothetical protein